MAKSYAESQNMIYTAKLREYLKELPAFLQSFYDNMSFKEIAIRTRVGYAEDYLLFFRYFSKKIEEYVDYNIHDLPIEFLDKISKQNLVNFFNDIMLYCYVDDEVYPIKTEAELAKFEKKAIRNGVSGKRRKFSAISAMYKFYSLDDCISTNPTATMELPRASKQPIVRLEDNEVSEMLGNVENSTGNTFTKIQKEHLKRYSVRDLAVCTLLLGTGVRVSECVGINIKDVDFANSTLSVHRKGNKSQILYLSDEVTAALYNYYIERKDIVACEGHESAFFLSNQRKRLCVRSVENLVKKYADTVAPNKNIHAHLCRKTYGTKLLEATDNLKLVKEVLGHNSIQTTDTFYTTLSTSKRREVTRLTLRDE